MGPGSAAPAPTVPGAKAKLINGSAVAPEDAPQEVKDIIAAANKIDNKPYIYGGGHGSFKDKGYDCSGAVSFALHGADLLDTPLDSSSLAKWGEPGAGQWVSVYGAPSHAYMVVAGLRFDTSMTPGNGPGWSRSMRSTTESYKVRHPLGL
jgi:cell wall-associated NlpC family hydrolase